MQVILAKLWQTEAFLSEGLHPVLSHLRKRSTLFKKVILLHSQLIVIPSHHSVVLLNPAVFNHLNAWLPIEVLEVTAHWLRFYVL